MSASERRTCAAAGTALPPPCAGYDVVVGVPLRTRLLARVLCGRALAAHGVGDTVHGIEVRRIHTVPNTTQVVERHPDRDWADLEQIQQPVRALRYSTQPGAVQYSIPVAIDVPEPRPTSVLVLRADQRERLHRPRLDRGCFGISVPRPAQVVPVAPAPSFHDAVAPRDAARSHNRNHTASADETEKP